MHNARVRRPLTLRNRPASDPTDAAPFTRGIDSLIRGRRDGGLQLSVELTFDLVCRRSLCLHCAVVDERSRGAVADAGCSSEGSGHICKARGLDRGAPVPGNNAHGRHTAPVPREMGELAASDLLHKAERIFLVQISSQPHKVSRARRAILRFNRHICQSSRRRPHASRSSSSSGGGGHEIYGRINSTSAPDISVFGISANRAGSGSCPSGESTNRRVLQPALFPAAPCLARRRF